MLSFIYYVIIYSLFFSAIYSLSQCAWSSARLIVHPATINLLFESKARRPSGARKPIYFRAITPLFGLVFVQVSVKFFGLLLLNKQMKATYTIRKYYHLQWNLFAKDSLLVCLSSFWVNDVCRHLRKNLHYLHFIIEIDVFDKPAYYILANELPCRLVTMCSHTKSLALFLDK